MSTRSTSTTTCQGDGTRGNVVACIYMCVNFNAALTF